jgi:uncharacterized protein YgfB (UPF0149 family)
VKEKMNEKNNMINQEINEVLNRMKEINRITYKLEDNSLSMEEKLRLTTSKKEKVEDLRKICKLHLKKSESDSKSEYKPSTREERKDNVPVVDNSFWRYIRDKYR